LHDAECEHSGTAQTVLNVAGRVVAANDLTRIMFVLNPRDIGRPIQDVEVSRREYSLANWFNKFAAS